MRSEPKPAMSDDEARLIEAAKAGDREAFAELYERFQPKIYRYIRLRVDNIATAEDLTSEVFVRVVDSIDHFRYQGRPILAWLYTIARNLLTDHYRRAGRTEQVPLNDFLPAETRDPSQRAHYALLEEELVGALRELTEDQRNVIVLKFYEEFDNATTAEMLNKSIGAVKSLQHRALAALARSFARLGAD
ncbi:MAG: sigma-70 family RNA polymerase sigma factor [Anaerolineae bacterium]